MPEFYKEKDPFRELIKKSGHNLHLEVAKILESKGWQVELSPYYYDEVIERPREIDIVASKEKSHGVVGSGETKRYKIFLFIECKYLNKEVVFWEVVFWIAKPNFEKIRRAILKIPKGVNFSEDLKIAPLEKLKGIFSFHRYFKAPFIAKLYATNEKDRKDPREDPIFSSFTNAIHSLISFRDESDISEAGIYYPVVVYEPGERVRILLPGETENYKKLTEIGQDILLLEVNYLYKCFTGNYPDFSRRSYTIQRQLFFVDFVEKNNLNRFLDELEDEDNNIYKLLI
jgi:hypothetical protein